MNGSNIITFGRYLRNKKNKTITKNIFEPSSFNIGNNKSSVLCFSTRANNIRLFLSQLRDKIGAKKNTKANYGSSSGRTINSIKVRENIK